MRAREMRRSGAEFDGTGFRIHRLHDCQGINVVSRCAQLIAAVLKARVYPGKGKEIGWGGIELTEAGRRSPLRFLDGYKPVLHWHGDIFDLPEGAELLASTPMTPHQAFRVGNHVLALQFHPEADADRLESWLVGHACELAHAAVDPRRLRQETRRVGPNAREAGQAMLRDWLAQW